VSYRHDTSCRACQLGKPVVVFDAAGTLFSQRDLAGQLAVIAVRSGYQLSPEQFAGVLAQLDGLPVWPEDSRDHGERLRRWSKFFCRAFKLAGIGDAAVNAACARLAAEYVSDAASYEEMPDVIVTLAAMAAHGHRMAVASNFDYLLDDILCRLGLDRYFDAIVKSVDLGVYKPDPEFYAAMLRLIGAAPGEVLFVGDAPRSDVLGPRDAGIASLLVDRTCRYAELGLPSLGALTELIGSAGGTRCRH
jgi:HAD superfamily hydrolase (TIGR01549 family)